MPPSDDLNTRVCGLPGKGYLDHKRFNLPGVKIISDCPHCRRSQEKDLGVECIYYGGMNQENKVHFYCDECDAGGVAWTVVIFLETKINFVRTEIDTEVQSIRNE